MGKLSPPHTVRALIDGGLPLPAMLEATTALTRYLHRCVMARSSEGNDEFVRTLHAIATSSMVRARPAAKIMCGKGCSLCCRSHVSIMAPEAFALARTIRGRRHAALHGRLRGMAALVAVTTVTERRRAAVYCSFLVDDACSVYAARPLTCRMLVSLDFRACEVSAAGGEDRIPQPNDYAQLRSLLGMCAFAALRAAGLPLVAYELNQLMTRLVDDPGAEARWYAGEAVLEGGQDALAPEFLVSVERAVREAGL